MTTPERHEKVYELFVKARELAGDEQRSFLDRACAGDAALRAEVEARLAQQGDLGDFLEKPLLLSDALPDAGGADTRSSDQRRAGFDSDMDQDQLHFTVEGYGIVRELHRGGQGVVYQAIQKTTKRKVAIKVLREGPYATKSAKARFEREIEFAAQLKHPNIITVFESGTSPQGWQYYVMDYIRGLPLTRHVRENDLGLEDTLEIFSQVCDAVQYAHHRGVIHRDLKPSNILVDSEGKPWVLDFGLAKQLLGPVDTIVSLTQEVIGTLPYMSPEQAKGNPDHIDMRTDIYALGVILYETLTGHYPYPITGHMAEVLKHIADTPPTPPSRQWTPDSGVTKRSSKHLRAGKCPIDDELQTVILKTLAKERERRYQSAGALAEDISHYLANEPIEAKRDSGWYVFKKAAVRHKAKLAAAGIFALLIAAFVVYEGRESKKAEARARETQADVLVAEGRELEDRKRTAEALSKYDAALALKPDHYKAVGYRAFLLKGEYFTKELSFSSPELLKQSMEYCKRALEIRPDSHASWNLLAILHFSLGDLKEAEKAARRSLEVKSDYFHANTNLAKILALQKRFDEALAVAEKGASASLNQEEQKKHADGIWRVIGAIQLYLGKSDALQSLLKAEEINKRDTRNLLLLSRIYMTLPGLQDDDKALEKAKLAVAFTGLKDPRFKRVLAQALLRQGEYADAVTNATAALAKGDDPAYCHMIAAIAQARLGKLAEAKQHLKDATEKWPSEFQDGEDVVVTAEKGLLWFDTLAELKSLQSEAQQLLESEPR